MMRLLAALLASLMACAAPAKPVTVQLLAINDVHGAVEPPAGKDGMVGDVPAGGIAYLATHLKRATKAKPNSLIVGAGDMYGASPFLSAFQDEAPIIAALNAMHLAVSSIGNHELDDGFGGLRRRLAGQCKTGKSCVRPAWHYLAANVRAEGRPLLPATEIRTIGGVRIGFIGATAENTAGMLTTKGAQGLSVTDPAIAANDAARRLEAQGVRAIVLLIHAGGRQKVETGQTADPDGCVGLSGDIMPVLAKLSPAIRIVISAHTHRAYNCRIDGRLVTSADAFGRMFTRVTLGVDPKSDQIVSIDAKNVVATRDVPPDPVQLALLARYRPVAAKVSGRIVGQATAAVTRTENASGESPLGDLLADAALAIGPPADVAFTNGGGIRADLTPDANGQVSFGALYAIQPFGNDLMTATMSGDALRRLLEQQFSGRTSPYVLQVSAGFTYRFRRDAPDGQHVEPGSIRLRGAPVAPDAQVRVRASNFLLDGGDGFPGFRETKDAVQGGKDLDALVAYVARHSPLAAPVADRIVRTDQ